MKYEWRKQEKSLYGVTQTPVVVEVPKQKFILITGQGDPNEVDFSNKISALYSLAYAIKMLFKATATDKITDFTVYPLEGLWEKSDEKVLVKNKLKYTLMIKQPDFITQDIFIKAFENVKKKKPNALYDKIRFEEIKDGMSIQILHIGSYNDEPKSFEIMDELAGKFNLTRTGDFHREIYLSKNRTSEDKQKTILRYSVR